MFDYFLKGERPAYVSRVAALDSCTLMHLRVLNGAQTKTVRLLFLRQEVARLLGKPREEFVEPQIVDSFCDWGTDAVEHQRLQFGPLASAAELRLSLSF
jgi:hypothetical protein